MLSRLLTALLGSIGAATAAQFPAFYDQYLQHLSGRLLQVNRDLEGLRAQAEARGMDPQEYLTAARAEGGEIAGGLADGYAGILDSARWLEAAFARLQSASAMERPFALAESFDASSAETVWSNFAPAVPFSSEGLAYAFLGLLIGVLLAWLMEALLGGVGRIGRRKGGKRPAKDDPFTPPTPALAAAPAAAEPSLAPLGAAPASAAKDEPRLDFAPAGRQDTPAQPAEPRLAVPAAAPRSPDAAPGREPTIRSEPAPARPSRGEDLRAQPVRDERTWPGVRNAGTEGDGGPGKAADNPGILRKAPDSKASGSEASGRQNPSGSQSAASESAVGRKATGAMRKVTGSVARLRQGDGRKGLVTSTPQDRSGKESDGVTDDGVTDDRATNNRATNNSDGDTSRSRTANKRIEPKL